MNYFRRVKKECIDAIIGRSYVGDWLLFYLLGQNIDSGAYKVNKKEEQFSRDYLEGYFEY